MINVSDTAIELFIVFLTFFGTRRLVSFEKHIFNNLKDKEICFMVFALLDCTKGLQPFQPWSFMLTFTLTEISIFRVSIYFSRTLTFNYL